MLHPNCHALDVQNIPPLLLHLSGPLNRSTNSSLDTPCRYVFFRVRFLVPLAKMRNSPIPIFFRYSAEISTASIRDSAMFVRLVFTPMIGPAHPAWSVGKLGPRVMRSG